MKSPIEIAAYYFPNYHVDPRNELAHGKGWTEWDLVTRAEARFPGHRQPLQPAWGYEDESDPRVMAKKINCAADHGLDVFLYDWYYYEDGPFLERGLEQGFLKAENRDRMRFALMWANHTWVDIHPAKATPNPSRDARVLYPGEVSPAAFRQLTERVIENYFRQPNYWKIHGCPYFSIYDLNRFLAGMGGIEAARQALDAFRIAVKRAGFPGLHLNAVLWNYPILPGETSVLNPAELFKALGFDSFASYVWIHHIKLPDFPTNPYAEAHREYFAFWDRIQKEVPLPYLPNVTMGWDSSPRTVASDRFEKLGYPFMSTLEGNTPERFGAALSTSLDRIRERSGHLNALTINAWNEWTEGSYLEPDTHYGLRYLEEILKAKRHLQEAAV